MIQKENIKESSREIHVNNPEVRKHKCEANGTKLIVLVRETAER